MLGNNVTNDIPAIVSQFERAVKAVQFQLLLTDHAENSSIALIPYFHQIEKKQQSNTNRITPHPTKLNNVLMNKQDKAPCAVDTCLILIG